MARSTLVFTYVCSKGSDMAVLCKLECTDIDNKFTLYQPNQEMSVASKQAAENELCRKYNEVLLTSRTMIQEVELDELIKG